MTPADLRQLLLDVAPAFVAGCDVLRSTFGARVVALEAVRGDQVVRLGRWQQFHTDDELNRIYTANSNPTTTLESAT